MRKLIIGICLLVFATSAKASEFYTQNPAEVASVFKASAPSGTGVLRQMLLRAYEAAYWQNAKAEALSLTYFWDIDGPDIVERTVREMKIVRPGLSAAKLEEWGVAMNGVIPNVVEGERITAIHTKGAAVTQFYHQGKKTGEIKGKDFADAFFAIWLDPATSAPDLRAKLIGK